MKKNDLFVYNLAIRRDDGKIEQDTVYREKLFTKEEVEDISKKYFCSVLVSLVGTYHPVGKDFSKKNSFYVEMSKPVEVKDDGNN